MRFRVPAAAMAAVALSFSSSMASPRSRFGEWSTPQPFTALNSPLLEFPTFISEDGLSLYLQRGTGIAIGEDLWVSRRRTLESPWPPPERLPDTVNSSANDRGAAISPDGHWLFFGSDRAGGLGNFDIWASWRADVHDDFAWQPAVNVAALNTSASESGPTFFQDDHAVQVYLVSSRPGGPGAQDIYSSAWKQDGSFSPPELVVELSSPFSDQRPYFRPDGREIVIHSNRPGSLGGFDVWFATRRHTDEAWSTPENPASLNSASDDVTGVLSSDGRTFFFGSNRSGEGSDVYFATRERVPGHDGEGEDRD
jgi:hypothetical protein